MHELKEQIQTMTLQHKSEVQDLRNKLKEMMDALEEQKKLTQNVTEQKQELETLLKESQNAVEELRAQVTELENSKPNPGK